MPVISESVPSADSSASASSEISAPTEDATPPASEDAPPTESAMSAMSGGSGSVFGGADGSPSTIKQIIPGVDQTTGALIYKYPIKVPPGRNGVQPQINLSYNSLDQDPSTIVGHGWTIDIPYIKRINRKGVDKLYTEDYFESSLTGELVNASGATYESKVDNGEFLKYVFASSTWVVTDKTGTIYTFGSASSTRQDNPSSSTQIFAWMLENVQDLNGNSIAYTYYKNAGQIYPSTIAYTGFSTSTAPFEVDFIRETRPDISLKFDTGFAATTTYRISEITAKYNNSWVRNYTLGYATGTFDGRALLDTIIETGRSEASTTVTLPATDFNYQGDINYFTEDSAWACPIAVMSTQGVIFADVNADGLPDILQATNTTTSAYLNNGSAGWDINTTFRPPMEFYTSVGTPHDLGVRLGDINGDGRVDLVQRGSTATSTYFNTASGWSSTSSAAWTVPVALASSDDADPGSRFIDLNGDGLPDFISTTGSSSSPTTSVWLNTGSSFATSTGWSSPVMLQDGTILADLNNDGLIDILYSASSTGVGWVHGAYLNTGNKSWVATSDFDPPKVFKVNGIDQGIREADVNGDGYSDIVEGKYNTSSTYLNTGSAWQSTSAWVSSYPFTDSNNLDTGNRLTDYNGDGMVDMANCRNGYSNMEKNLGVRADLLSRVKLPTGGIIDIAYKGTPQFQNGSTILNSQLPFVINAVSSITRNSGFGVYSTTTLSYEGGKYYFGDAFDRKMAGFAEVISTDSASNTTSYFYHQGDTSSSTIGEYNDSVSKIGKIYRTEIRDSSSNLYSLSISKWDQASTTAGSFVKRIQTTLLQYDGNGGHKDKAESYSYATTTGNLISKIEWGEVTGSDDGTFSDAGSDKRTTDITYASNTATYVFALPATEALTNASGTKIKESRYYYDTLSLGSVGNGNLTKIEKWKSGSSYVNVQKTYNSYGLVTQETDPRSKTITYSYDTNNLYPATSTNALGQATSYSYDYSSGKPSSRKDPNSRTFTTTFDGLDRPIEEDQPDLSTSTLSVAKTTYAYTDSYNNSSVLKTDYLDSSTGVATYSYLDGFGRTIQTRRQAEDVGIFVTNDTVYNNLERTDKESLPYFSASHSRTSATSTASLYTTYGYDPMLRVTSVANAVGTTTTTYDDWKTTITDARGKPKSLYNDAYGNLKQVDEVNGSSTYTTTYTYDLNDNLTKITDALSNIRNFTYDGLSRRLTAEDLHASADVTFGAWTYTYDDSNNLTQTVDPKSQTVNYTYDDINRLLTEDYTSATGTEASYAYDSCTEGVGRLCIATSTGATVQYLYNVLGGISQETKTVSSTAYQTSYTYDRQGNILNIINPDGSEIKYVYNFGGLLEQVLWKEP